MAISFKIYIRQSLVENEIPPETKLYKDDFGEFFEIPVNDIDTGEFLKQCIIHDNFNDIFGEKLKPITNLIDKVGLVDFFIYSESEYGDIPDIFDYTVSVKNGIIVERNYSKDFEKIYFES